MIGERAPNRIAASPIILNYSNAPQTVNTGRLAAVAPPTVVHLIIIV